jgi:hypothetical protein
VSECCPQKYISKKEKIIVLLITHEQVSFVVVFFYFLVSSLTLIRAAGGVYDFRNFEEVYLCNGLSSDLEISCIPRKTSREYILLNTLEQKMAFLAIYRPKRARNHPFFRRFWLFRTAVKVYMTSLPPPQGWAIPPPIVGAPSSSGCARTLSSSF